MPRIHFAILCCALGCATPPNPPQSAPIPVAAPPQPENAAPVAPTIPAGVARAQRDSFVAFERRSAADSLADEAALDSLQDVEATDAMPELTLTAPTWDIDVTTFGEHPRVQYYLRFFTGGSRDRFQVWLDRMPRFEGYARARLAERDLPGDLVYLALIESGFSSVAVSRSSAVGMWQFMAGTGRGYGMRIDGWVDERRDPIKATDAAARHLEGLSKRFGSHYLAAAAYNGGAGRVGRGLTRMNAAAGDGDEESVDMASDDAFFELAGTAHIFQETKDYVPKLIAAALIAKEPTKYGFRKPRSVAPFPRDSVMVDGGTGLDLIARLADTTIDALRELNPHLLRMVTPPGRRYAVRVPAGLAPMIAESYARLPDSERTAIASHVVRRGETVALLAKRYGVSANLIRAANSNARGKRLAVGSTVHIPTSASIPESTLREPEPVVSVAARTHTVRRGETLGGIANRYGVTQAAIRSANKLSRAGVVRVGQKLVIRRATRSTTLASSGGATASRSVTSAAARRTHVVKPGETVGGIAGRYGVAQSALLAANRLGKRGLIRVGQMLRIPA